MKILNKAEILASRPLEMEAVPVPEWGTDAAVNIRVMSAAERDRFERHSKLPDPQKSLSAFFASLIICDEKGEAIFTEADVQSLGKQDWRILDRILAAGIKLNALGKDEKELLKKS